MWEEKLRTEHEMGATTSVHLAGISRLSDECEVGYRRHTEEQNTEASTWNSACNRKLPKWQRSGCI